MACADPLARHWADLSAHLESRIAELSEEIRSYPTPIARCDEQLTGLIEKRGHALDQRKAMQAIESAGATRFFDLAKKFSDSHPPSDDPIESALLARLREALARSRSPR